MAVDALILDPGSLRHLVSIQQPSLVADALGQTSSSWTTILVTRAYLSQIAGKLMYQTGNLSSSVTHTMRIRYPGAAYTIKPGYQVIFGAHTYQIVNVDNVQERNRVYEFLLLEIDGAN